MRRNLVSVGNSLGLLIEKPILELLKISRDTVLDVSTDGRRLIIEPVVEARSLPSTPEPSEEPEPDFADPAFSVQVVDQLVSRFHMDNKRFRRLHHARNYDNTFKAHRDYSAGHSGRFQAGGTNELTARRLWECLKALKAGRPWDAAIEIATGQYPR